MATEKKTKEEAAELSIDAQLKEMKEGVDALWAVVRGIKSALGKMWNVKVDDANKTLGLMLALGLCAMSAFGVGPLADTNVVLSYDDPTSTTNKLLTLDRQGNLSIDGTLTYEGSASSTISNIAVEGKAWLNATSGEIGGGGLTAGKIIIGSAVTNWEPMTVSGDITIATNGVVTIADAAVADNDIALADTKIIVGNAGGTGAAVTVSGAATLANDGALTLAGNIARERLTNAFVTATSGPIAVNTNVTVPYAASLTAITTPTAGEISPATNFVIKSPGNLLVLQSGALGAVQCQTNVTFSAVSLKAGTVQATAGQIVFGTNVSISGVQDLATTAGALTLGTNFTLSGVTMSDAGGPIGLQTNVNWAGTIGPVSLPTNVQIAAESVTSGAIDDADFDIPLIGSTVRLVIANGIITGISTNP
jgi:hypothetical protein